MRDIRRLGSAALDLAWLAAGRYDAYYEYGLNAWDWAAGEMLCGAVGLETRHLAALPGTGAGLLVAAPAIVDALEAIARLAGAPAGDWRAIGLDPQGIDIARDGRVVRAEFDKPVTEGSLRMALKTLADRGRAMIAAEASAATGAR